MTDNKYFQFKADFTTSNTAYSPKLYNVTLNYSRQIIGTEANITSTTAITDNIWHLATITFDNNANENNFRLYLDGNKEAEKTEHNLPSYKDNDLTIGQGFEGDLDEFRIYETALSSEQVSNDYNLGYNTMVSQETSAGDNWMCQVTPNDAEADGTTLNSNELSILVSITFNVTSGEDGSQISNFNVNCNNSFSASGVSSPYETGFLPGSYECTFVKTFPEYYNKTIIFGADMDKIVNIKMSKKAYLTNEEHTWLEGIYNCVVLGDCELYNLLLEINQTVGKIWSHTQPTDESVITFENITNKVVDSTHNLTIDYTVHIPIKAGYALGTYLPVRIGYWFMDETNTTCYNQGTKPTGVEEPYCQPLIAETIGQMGGSVSFEVKLHPNLPAGNYNVKRIIDIDPNNVWINYGQETIGMITLAEALTSSPGISLAKIGEAMPSSSSTSASSTQSTTSGGGSSVIYLNSKDSSDSDNSKDKEAADSNKPGITGAAIGKGGLLSGGEFVAVTVILCVTFVVFLVISSRTLIKIKAKK